MATTLCAKRLWTSSGWLSCAGVRIENGIICEILHDLPKEQCTLPVLIPGMIDLHLHGALAYAAANPDEAGCAAWLRGLCAHGVTAVLPTLSSAPADKIRDAVAFYDGLRHAPVAGGARVLGVHLEGPFLNPEKKGGIDPRYLQSPSLSHYEALTGEHGDAVKVVTLAPELEGADVLIRELFARGVHASAGHSNATAEEMRRAMVCGLDGVTHFFNAARPITHRDPGFLTAALLESHVYCEVVSDLVHLAPDILRLLVQAAGARRLAAVTDASAYTGLPDGDYGERVVVNGSPLLPNGTLTGGRYLLDGCARALLSIGIDPWDVVCMVSHTPARRVGRHDLGDIAVGCRADLVGMDENYRVLFTMIGGQGPALPPTETQFH